MPPREGKSETAVSNSDADKAWRRVPFVIRMLYYSII